ncbi:hypothetical protein [Actinophytocola sp. NPDC049390]|uniref:hypothetical protein n=1 Tax=Actinophytocola sp. NPDC049390 TaxID=3363894 RepID=UPI00379F0B6C
MNILASTAYRGRTLEVAEETRLRDATDEHGNEVLISTGRRHILVNGTRQFGFDRDTDPEFILAEARRYIDAADMAAERNAQLAAAGGYVPTRDAHFASSWRAAA